MLFIPSSKLQIYFDKIVLIFEPVTIHSDNFPHLFSPLVVLLSASTSSEFEVFIYLN